MPSPASKTPVYGHLPYSYLTGKPAASPGLQKQPENEYEINPREDPAPGSGASSHEPAFSYLSGETPTSKENEYSNIGDMGSGGSGGHQQGSYYSNSGYVEGGHSQYGPRTDGGGGGQMSTQSQKLPGGQYVAPPAEFQDPNRSRLGGTSAGGGVRSDSRDSGYTEMRNLHSNQPPPHQTHDIPAIDYDPNFDPVKNYDSGNSGRPTTRNADYNVQVRSGSSSSYKYESERDTKGRPWCCIICGIVFTAIVCLGIGFAIGWFTYENVMAKDDAGLANTTLSVQILDVTTPIILSSTKTTTTTKLPSSTTTTQSTTTTTQTTTTKKATTAAVTEPPTQETTVT